MFNKLLSQEDICFDTFHDIISRVQKIALLTHNFFVTDPYDKDILLKLKPIVKTCDDIISNIIIKLEHTFVTPFDKDDIISLITSFRNISDILLGAAARIEIFNLSDIIFGAKDITGVIFKQTKELELVFQDLKRNTSQINENKVMHNLEAEVNNAYLISLKKLFADGNDPINVVKKKEILEMLKSASDHCGITADIIVSIIIKNS